MVEYKPMLPKVGQQLDNKYVEQYYNTQVGALPVSYGEDRWHTSPIKEFEYRQTERALGRALGDQVYRQAIEVGPGDGVWTKLIKKHVSGELHLIEQSEEMLVQAQKNLAGLPGVTFERSDFLTSIPPVNNDLIVAMRCFEYFDDKVGALKKMRDLLAQDGVVIIVTKNKQLVTSSSVQGHTLHSDQVSRGDMHRLAASAGLRIEMEYPAIVRWKASVPLLRVLFDIFHKLVVWSRGMLAFGAITTYATESYVYMLRVAK